MRAMATTDHGSPEVLKLLDLPEPIVGDLDLLIEVYATAINPVDYKIRKTVNYGGVVRQMPFIQGYDVSGIVKALGRHVQHFKVGDAVYASPSLARPGANAERVAVDHRLAAHKPDSLDHVQAAALPLVTLTAWDCIHKRGAVQAGETVLIHAGAGGVGHIAVQLAKIAGCRVITTASRPETIDLCRKIGADVIINHAQEDFITRVQQETKNQGCAVVVDTVGGEVFDKSLECVAINGRMVTIVYNESAKIGPALFRKNATLHLEFMGVPAIHGIHPESQSETLRAAAALVDAGRLRPHVGKVISLEEIPEGHRLQESGRAIGKTVVKVR
ncbi:MAG: zinc-binding dehydrogenase [Phycisphaeraceae bacterium]|nr:zinc-binding dehydrogenase [Phycisphaeraceae bacterium]